MNKEDKKLLLIDICGRLPYKSKALVNGHFATILGIDENVVIVCIDGNDYKDETVVSADDNGDDIKLYLRPMSSMTEEERSFYEDMWFEGYHARGGDDMVSEPEIPYYLDWLHYHHFDYRGLIEKGLALEAPKDMYMEE